MAVNGLILAGGKSRRMGGDDKSFRMLGGKPLIAHVIERIRPQVSELIINAGDADRFKEFGLEVIADVVEGRAEEGPAGPLAGVLSGLERLAGKPGGEWLLTVPVDTPFLPPDLAERLTDAVRQDQADMACAMSKGRVHPTVGLWPVSMAEELRHALVVEGLRKARLWMARYRVARVAFDDAPADPFFNINRPEDLAEAEAAGE